MAYTHKTYSLRLNNKFYQYLSRKKINSEEKIILLILGFCCITKTQEINRALAKKSLNKDAEQFPLGQTIIHLRTAEENPHPRKNFKNPPTKFPLLKTLSFPLTEHQTNLKLF